ncbi:MAG: flagellar export chaperone FliS [Proteobacteria bacterium]|nr:flagellar export chaperone FliS [Pseudomonadota bacterium]HQR02816.1 flagellar export chaperone FliS [Rhodocyclaceae bacterium]
MNTHHRSAAYRNVGLETGITSASPHELILMLLDGALLSMAKARSFMATGDIPQKGQEISHAIEIISNGLHACLDYEAGGELATNLGALYDYMVRILVSANISNNPEAVAEAEGLLKEIRSGWEELAKDSAALSATGEPA